MIYLLHVSSILLALHSVTGLRTPSETFKKENGCSQMHYMHRVNKVGDAGAKDSFHITSLHIGSSACFQLVPKIAEKTNQLKPDTFNVTDKFFVLKVKKYTQTYGVSARYEFAVPLIESNCSCDCRKTKNFCNQRFAASPLINRGDINLQLSTSPKAASGHAGCGEKVASYCCSIGISRYQGKEYHALQLQDPTASVDVILLTYVFGVAVPDPILEDTFPFTLNMQGTKGTFSGFSSNHMEVEVESRIVDVIDKRDTFYTDSSQTNLFRETDVNHFKSRRDSSKLGFMHKDQGEWSMTRTAMELGKHYEPEYDNCLTQSYTHKSDIAYAALKRVSETEVVETEYAKRIINESLRTNFQQDRKNQVKRLVIQPASGRNLGAVKTEMHGIVNINVFLDKKLDLSGAFQLGNFTSFTANIEKNRDSQVMLVVNLVGGSNKLKITVVKKDQSTSSYFHSCDGNNQVAKIRLPHDVRGRVKVCVEPAHNLRDGNVEAPRQCKPVDVKEVDRLAFFDSYLEVDDIGNCPECNLADPKKSALSGFLDHLNPKTWFKGLSWTESIFTVAQIAGYVILVLILMCIIRKFIWPLCKCAFGTEDCCKQSSGTGRSEGGVQSVRIERIPSTIDNRYVTRDEMLKKY